MEQTFLMFLRGNVYYHEDRRKLERARRAVMKKAGKLYFN